MWRPVAVSSYRSPESAAAGGTAVAQATRYRSSAAIRQPGRGVGNECARGDGIAIEPLAQLADAAGIAEREVPGGELIENASERVDVAARIAAHSQHLLGRHVDPVTYRKTKLLGQQVGKMAVVGQPEIDQHCFTARPIQHVGGF